LAPAVVENIAATGVGNPITAVLMSFRAMDTLLEAIVLLLGLVGVWSLAPDRFWGGRPGPAPTEDPNSILGYLARVLPPIGIVVGVYILWVGADHPGGKFQGATVLAAMWLLVMMAGLSDAPAVDRRWVRIALAGGPAAFIAVGLLGSVIAGAFLGYPEAFAKPLIVVIEAALLPSLAVTLALLLTGPPSRKDTRE
jgi:multisubunit Na+/H+ antiporter MnhB subunit